MSGTTRRELIATAAMAAFASATANAAQPDVSASVTATEDLMREHGIIRRALLVYAEMGPRIRDTPASVDPSGLLKTAKLFRDYGEDFHERLLEEQHVFPYVKKIPLADSYLDVLMVQHQRGRDITDYIAEAAGGARIASSNARPLAHALTGFVRMYEHHAAREDTIIFPAWKTNFTDRQLDEIAQQFEHIERVMFGHDGFADAEKTIAGVEAAYGLAEIGQFTAPAPPKSAAPKD
jgi:hemerythrin-like domain-containing protein